MFYLYSFVVPRLLLCADIGLRQRHDSRLFKELKSYIAKATVKSGPMRYACRHIHVIYWSRRTTFLDVKRQPTPDADQGRLLEAARSRVMLRRPLKLLLLTNALTDQGDNM